MPDYNLYRYFKTFIVLSAFAFTPIFAAVAWWLGGFEGLLGSLTMMTVWTSIHIVGAFLTRPR